MTDPHLAGPGLTRGEQGVGFLDGLERVAVPMGGPHVQPSARAGRLCGKTILRAAAEVFAQAGYCAGKVSDVAARVGVTEPVIFQNFGSKAALFAAVLERAAAEVRVSLDDLAAGFGSASGLLAHVLTPFVTRAIRPGHDGSRYPARRH